MLNFQLLHSSQAGMLPSPKLGLFWADAHASPISSPVGCPAVPLGSTALLVRDNPGKQWVFFLDQRPVHPQPVLQPDTAGGAWDFGPFVAADTLAALFCASAFFCAGSAAHLPQSTLTLTTPVCLDNYSVVHVTGFGGWPGLLEGLPRQRRRSRGGWLLLGRPTVTLLCCRCWYALRPCKCGCCACNSCAYNKYVHLRVKGIAVVYFLI